jgi:hypothetical protein
MSIINFLELKEKLEIQKYVNPENLDKKNHIFFSGQPGEPGAGRRFLPWLNFITDLRTKTLLFLVLT